MTSNNQDRLTELFARAIVLQRRSAALVEVLGQSDVPLDVVRDIVTKVTAHANELDQLLRQSTGVEIQDEHRAPRQANVADMVVS